MKARGYLLVYIIICCFCWAMASRSSDQNLRNTAHPVGEFLKIAMIGVKPYLFLDGREVKGSDLHLLQLLSKKLNFNYSMTFATEFDKIVMMVNIKIEA